MNKLLHLKRNALASHLTAISFILGFLMLWSAASATGAPMKSSPSINQTIDSAAPYRYVKVEGRQLLTDFDHDGIYQPYLIKGVGYDAMPIGRHPSDWGWPVGDLRTNNILDDDKILRRDFTLLEAMHANTIRIWKGEDTFDPKDGRFPNKLTTKTLEFAGQHNIKIIAGFWVNPMGGFNTTGVYEYYFDITNPAVQADLLNRFAAYVTSFKNNPDILFWAIGNENNLHFNPTDTAQRRAWFYLCNEMGKKVREIEGPAYHPVAIVNGDLGYIGDANAGASDNDLRFIDIWGANVYRGITFGDFFNEYRVKSTKPFWFSEYGIDAFYAYDFHHPDDGYEDQAAQALWDGQLWDEIVDHHDVTIGGTVMAYADEWWQPYEWICGAESVLCNSRHDTFGVGPIDLSHPPDGIPDFYPTTPDHFWHQEWWGLMSVQKDGDNPDIMTPRQVYYTLQKKFDPMAELAIDKNGNGASVGIVTSVPSGIQCGRQCKGTFPKGTKVRLKWSSTDANVQMIGWSTCGASLECEVNLNQDTVVETDFLHLALSNQQIQDISVTPQPTVAGSSISIRTLVKNWGDGAVINGTLDITISTVGWSRYLVHSLPPLLPSSQQEFNEQITLPMQSGTYMIHAVVNSQNDSNLNNNSRNFIFKVQMPSSQKNGGK